MKEEIKIYVTSYGMVKSDNKFFSETLIDDFIKNIKFDDRYSVKFKNDSIFIKSKNREYQLSLTKEELSCYINGNYENLSAGLRKIFDLVKYKEAIDLAKKGVIQSEYSKIAYLEYLEEKSKLSLKEYFSNLIKDLLTVLLDSKNFLDNKLADGDPYIIVWGLISFALSIATGGTAALLYFPFEKLNLTHSLLLGFSPFIITFSVPILTYIVKYLNKRLPKLSKFFKKHQLIKNKIKQLEKLKFKENVEVLENSNEDKINKNLNSTYDERFLLDASFKTNFYERLTSLVSKINNLDENDQKMFALKLHSLVKEFEFNKNKLEDINPDDVNLILNDKYKIKNILLFKLDELEKLYIRLIEKSNRIEEDDIKIKKIIQDLEQYTDLNNESYGVKTLKK